ncbi:MAG: OmpP1/FadL family transporter [Allosphingosinicella sp.]
MLLFGTGIWAGLTAPAPARAAGFYLQEQSVKGWGRANSGEAADRGPDSLWWNPAAISGDTRPAISFGATAVFPSGRVEDRGTLIDRPVVPAVAVGGQAVMKDPIQAGVAPHFALSLPLSRQIALGLAVTSPYSFTTDYDPSGWQRYSAIRTRLVTLDVQPSIAFAPSEAISLGVGLNLEYADAFLSNALPNLAPGSPDARLRLTGDGWDLGWSAGVQLRPAPRVAIGLAYKSSVEHRLQGPVSISGLLGPLAARNVEARTTARFSTPWQLILGARAGVSRAVTVNAQIVRFGWSRFGTLDVGAPVSNAIAENYRDTWSLALGADAELNDRLTVRAGIQLDPTPTRDASRDPRVPDGDRVDYNIGASLRLGGAFTLDAAAALTKPGASPITRDEHFYAGTGAQTDILTEGRARSQHVLVLALGGRLTF